jgi:hypothetical protein
MRYWATGGVSDRTGVAATSPAECRPSGQRRGRLLLARRMHAWELPGLTTPWRA